MSIEFWLPWIGTVTGGLMLAAPTIQARELYSAIDVGALTPKFYVFQFLNCVGWTVYGVLIPSTAITFCNAFGIIIAVYCTLCFLATARRQESEGRPPLTVSYKSSLGLSAAALGVGLGLCAVVSQVAVTNLFIARQITGLFSDLVGMCMLVSPLEQMKRIMETKNAETLSPPLVSVALVNGILWSWYGVLRLDPYIMIPNTVGVVSMTVQGYFLLKFGRGKNGGNEAPPPAAVAVATVVTPKCSGHEGDEMASVAKGLAFSSSSRKGVADPPA